MSQTEEETCGEVGRFYCLLLSDFGISGCLYIAESVSLFLTVPNAERRMLTETFADIG